MKKAALLACLVLPVLSLAQTADISGGWRMTATDDPGNALPTADDSGWTAGSLPLHRATVPAGVWFRRTVDPAPGVDTLVLGGLRPYRIYLNGIEQQAGAESGPSLFRFPAAARHFVIAIRFGTPDLPSPNQVIVEGGPFLIASRDAALAIADDARIRLWRGLGPFALLGGVQITLAIALIVIWLVTERRYAALLWLSLYMLYAAHNLLRLSFFPGLPPSPRNIPAVLSLQIALAIVGWDSLRTNLALWSGYAVLLILPGQAASVGTGIVNASVSSASVVIMAIGAWRSKEIRATALTGCFYWTLPPCSILARMPLVVETSTGFWPVLGLLNVPLTLTVVLLFITRFGDDRRERTRLQTEFEAARAVQQLLLPEAHIARGNLQIDAAYYSAQETGGDFYYVLDAAPDKVMLVIGDVSGKGLRAAMVVSLLIGVLRETRESSPSGVLHSLNAALLRKQNSGFVTACCACFERGELLIAGAGHPNPFIDGREIELIPGLPLGCDPDVEYVEGRFDLQPGVRITFVSDGVVEAANAARELFGFDRTRAISGKPADEIANIAKGWGQNDDITVVTAHRVV